MVRNAMLGGSPIMYPEPEAEQPWYRKPGYRPTNFMIDAVAKFIGEPLYNIMSGKTHAAMDSGQVGFETRDQAARAGLAGMEGAGLAVGGSVFTKAPAGALRTGAALKESNVLSPLQQKYATPEQIAFLNARENGKVANAYHGTNAAPFDKFDDSFMSSRTSGEMNPPDGEGAFFFGGRDTANGYASDRYTVPTAETMRDLWAKHSNDKGQINLPAYNAEAKNIAHLEQGGYVMPTRINTSNFGTYNARGYKWLSDEGDRLKAQIDKAKAEGKSGLVVKNMEDGVGTREPQYAVWDRGNVFSATTGDLLYSNTGAGAVVPQYSAEQPRNSMYRQF